MPPSSTAIAVRRAVQELQADAFQQRKRRMTTLDRSFVRTARRFPLRFMMADGKTPKVTFGSALTKTIYIARRLRPQIGEQGDDRPASASFCRRGAHKLRAHDAGPHRRSISTTPRPAKPSHPARSSATSMSSSHRKPSSSASRKSKFRAELLFLEDALRVAALHRKAPRHARARMVHAAGTVAYCDRREARHVETHRRSIWPP